jgi:hypothetical protein
MLMLGVNSDARSFLNAGDDGVVPGVDGDSGTYPNFLTFKEVEIGKLVFDYTSNLLRGIQNRELQLLEIR